MSDLYHLEKLQANYFYLVQICDPMKILKIISIVLLVILPFSTILSNFSPYWTTHTFQTFLVASLILAVVSWLLGWWIAPQNWQKPGLYFFLLGAVIGPPLMLGPPEMSARLLERASEEHFRYGMLMLATVLFAIGFLAVSKQIANKISGLQKIIFLPFAISVILMIWDNYSSFNFSSEMSIWINSGKSAEDFILQYDFHELIRTTGRMLAYLSTAWLSWLLFKNGCIPKWTTIILTIFCGTGILFFFLFNFIGPAFYFPMMVPAFVLAPAYWLGITMISRNK